MARKRKYALIVIDESIVKKSVLTRISTLQHTPSKRIVSSSIDEFESGGSAIKSVFIFYSFSLLP